MPQVQLRHEDFLPRRAASGRTYLPWLQGEHSATRLALPRCGTTVVVIRSLMLIFWSDRVTRLSPCSRSQTHQAPVRASTSETGWSQVVLMLDQSFGG